jgi:polynucleotide 5'-hydroxyl-kinase GRC3/NOL9
MNILRRCEIDFQNYKINNNKQLPLIINTMGWNQDLGLSILKETILLYKPTHVIQIDHPIDLVRNMPILDKQWLNNTQGLLQSKEIQLEHSLNYNLLKLKPKTLSNLNKQKQPSIKSFLSRDHRDIAIISYLSQMPMFNSLSTHLIYSVSYSSIALHVCHIKIKYDDLINIFENSLVGLCEVDSKYIQKNKENSDLISCLNYTDYNVKDIIFKCYGFGFIKHINKSQSKIEVFTHESIESLDKINIFVKGMLTLPNWFNASTN